MKKNSKREIIEWAILISIGSILYFTGKHTEVLGFVQRGILATGIFQAEQIDEAQQVQAAYNFQLRDKDGDLVDFSEFKGKTVFLNFWATWCPPCIAEMPDIHDLYEGLDPKEVVFVLISQDQDFQKALDFVNRKEYKFPVYSLNSRLPKVYHSQSIPTTFILSPDGKIVSKRSGMAKYNTDSFKSFLKEMSTTQSI